MPSVLHTDDRLVVFITGASSGLGRALAEDYANRPGSRLDSKEDQINIKRYRVFAGVRNLDSVRHLSAFVERVKIDVNDDDSVKTAVDGEAGRIGESAIILVLLQIVNFETSSQTFSSTMLASTALQELPSKWILQK